MNTLSEIQRILYLGDDFRTSKEMLRLHNCSFEHFILLKDVVCIKKLSEKMTRDRFFGKYQHNLCVHAPSQYFLISGESINCKDEERCFNLIKNITKDTSNYKPGHLIGNLIVRQEIENQCKGPVVYWLACLTFTAAIGVRIPVEAVNFHNANIYTIVPSGSNSFMLCPWMYLVFVLSTVLPSTCSLTNSDFMSCLEVIKG